MPWSDWQSGPTSIESFSKYAASRLFYGGSLTPGWETDPAGIQQLHASQWDVGFDTYGYGTEEIRISGMFYVVGDSWKTDRDWFPVELLGLEEGVDYGVRPDRTDMDDDAYVQYESDGDNTVTEEFKPLLRYEGDTESDEVSGDGTWALGLVPEPPLPEIDSDVREYPVVTWPGLGDVFETGGIETVGTSHSASFPNVAHLSSFLVSPVMTGVPPTSDQEGVLFTIGSPGFRYQTPRWRYWIPIEPPLRQRRRDDGLGLAGVPSARRGPSSRQYSNRTGRGYY